MKTFLSLLLLLPLLSCKHSDNHVVVGSSTVLGFEIGQNPASQMYNTKFGYVRAEFALVPSNRRTDTNSYAGGARDVPDVMLELRMHDILKGGGIYQRLAVGSNAVRQPGAALLFSKGSSGEVDPVVVDNVLKSFNSVPAQTVDVIAEKLVLAEAYSKTTSKAGFDAAAKVLGYSSFAEFLTKTTLTAPEVKAMVEALKAKNYIK